MRCGIWILVVLGGCAPASLEDYQREGAAISRRLARDLQKIQYREDLMRALPQIEKQFERLVHLMIEARNFEEKHPEDDSLYESEEESEMLRRELQRICSLEGGRDAIEKAQHEALIKLDAFERNLAKNKQKSSVVR